MREGPRIERQDIRGATNRSCSRCARIEAFSAACAQQPVRRRRSAWHGLVLRPCLAAPGAGAGRHRRPDARPAADHRRPLSGRLRAAAALRGLDNKSDAAFNLLLGEAALRTQRAEQAKALFERSLALQPDSIEAHLGLGRAYLALGDYASAKIEFETVMRFDDLPPDLQLQAEIYAAAAQGYAQGKRLLANGYAITGYGNYRTGARGGGPQNDGFFAARVGGNLNYELDNNYALDGSLDYRFRDYDNADRRNDSDLRWNGAVSRNVGEANWIAGLRGRVSYRGNSDYRNDFGIYGNYRLRLDPDNQVAAGLEVRQRRYPTGPLRERTRNIVELSGSWTTAVRRQGQLHAGRAGRARVQHPAQRRQCQLLRPVAVDRLQPDQEPGRLRLCLVAERALQRRAPRRRPATA